MTTKSNLIFEAHDFTLIDLENSKFSMHSETVAKRLGRVKIFLGGVAEGPWAVD
jgi:hypothetical protein